VRELFCRIREDDQKIVLATSGKKAEAQHYIEILGVAKLVDGATTADDSDRSKPAPDIFQAALEKLGGVSTRSALVVGDTPFDMQAADKAGLRAIGFLCGATTEDALRKAGAMTTFYDPADLLVRYAELLPLWSAQM
jgi:beta-phosphoglucomutase-like phosphatase (HAD superfamily)